MPLSDQAKQVRDFIISNLQHLQHSCGSGENLDFPSFDLMPFDYLEFAQNELNGLESVNKINCINHLKRASDCALDTLLQVLNVYKLFKKRNLKLEKKSEFIGAIGLFNSRSLSKLNSIRNKVEHEYAVPDNNDLELYFELVQAFVYALEGFMYMLANSASMDFIGDSKINMGVTYNFEKPSVIFELLENDKEIHFEFEALDIENFAFSLKIFFLLCRFQCLINSEFVVSELEKNQ